jgi:D-3-phosphoglycerate dehydrogenase / 2-oxoglutarate reductase
MPQPTSFPKEKIKIVLFEGIHQSAADLFHNNGYSNVELLDKALDGQALHDTIRNAHFIGVRSRTQITAEVLSHAEKLMAVGCFCIGTNQVDLARSRDLGVPVFNAPHSNTRSVAELVLAEMVMLVRGVTDKNKLCHEGGWDKSAANSFELRGKTLGIIGYGHIGSQLSILAEAFGMRVVYYDVVPKLAMGNAKQLDTMKEVFECSDAVSLHVPAAPDTVNLINADIFKYCKKGSIFINASRGNVVDVDVLASYLKSGHLIGAAVDVFPVEPASKNDVFQSPLRGLSNVILTPHIGGSTLEAQYNIGREVANKLVQYCDEGSTNGAVNFPDLSLPRQGDRRHRVLHIHKNQSGVLSTINQVLSEDKVNILGQYLQTIPEVGYVVIDIDREGSDLVASKLAQVPGTIRSRILF